MSAYLGSLISISDHNVKYKYVFKVLDYIIIIIIITITIIITIIIIVSDAVRI